MKRFQFLLISIFMATLAFAQNEKPFERQKIFSIVPQYVIQNGFRFDYEFTLRNNLKSWLQLSPELFISTHSTNISTDNYKSMIGAGLEIHHKYYLKEPNENGGYYFGYGGGLQFFGIKDNESVSYTYTENGTEYISFREEEVNNTINRLLLNFIIGKQVVSFKPFIVDYYLGVGFRYSVDKNLNLLNTYNSTWFDYGYSGSLLVSGIKIGFDFSK